MGVIGFIQGINSTLNNENRFIVWATFILIIMCNFALAYIFHEKELKSLDRERKTLKEFEKYKADKRVELEKNETSIEDLEKELNEFSKWQKAVFETEETLIDKRTRILIRQFETVLNHYPNFIGSRYEPLLQNEILIEILNKLSSFTKNLVTDFIDYKLKPHFNFTILISKKRKNSK